MRDRGSDWVGGVCLVLALACGPTVSLDASAPEASSSGATSASGSSTGGLEDGLESSASSLELPVDDLPPALQPGECPAGCTVDLPLTWIWEDEARAPDPTLPPERRLTAMVALLDGGWVVADQRGDEPWLTRVDPHGALVWSVPVSLDCACEITDLALYPSGNLAVLGQGQLSAIYTVYALGRFNLDAAYVEWVSWEILYGSETVPGRAGSVIPIDEHHAVVLAIQAGQFGRWDEEWIRAYYHEHDWVSWYRVIDVQLAGSHAGRQPRGTRLPGGMIAATVAAATHGASGYTAWMNPFDLIPYAAEVVPGVPEAVAVGLGDAIVVAGRTVVSPQQVVLQVTNLPHAQAPSWSFSTEVPTTHHSEPALAVDALGSAFVALRTTTGTPEDPRDPAIALTRLGADGTPVWSTSLDVAMEGSARPVAIAVTEDDAIVLAGVVDGRLHLERREQGCRCD